MQGRTSAPSPRQMQRPAPMTISDIICSFKSKCSVEYFGYLKQRNLYHSGGLWQRGYYDHIIRSEESYLMCHKGIGTTAHNAAPIRL